MEATGGKDFTAENTARATRLRTRLQTKAQQEKQTAWASQTEGLCSSKWWDKYVRTKDDVQRYYQLYHPEYPEILVKSIASRIEGIVQKSRTKEQFTEEEKQIIVNSKKPSSTWDPMEEILEHEFDAHLKNSIKRLEKLVD